MKERNENGSFKNLPDLYNRMAGTGNSLDKTAMEGLAYSNALSDFGANKNQILAMFPKLERNYKSTATDRALNQISFFGGAEGIEEDISYPNVPPMPPKQELEKENEVLGVYLSGHPSQILAPVIAADSSIISLEDLVAAGAKRYVVTCGMINGVRVFYTKKQEQMATFQLESQFSSISCVVFPGDMASCLGEIRDQNIAIITGSYVQNRNNEEMQFIVNSIVCAESFSDITKPFPVYIQNKEEQDVVMSYIKENPGNRKVMLCGSNGRNAELKYRVNLTLRTLNYLSGEFHKDVLARQ